MIEPADPKRCQRNFPDGSFMTLGPRTRRRCENVPVTIAVGRKRSKDGLHGRMSLCLECKQVLVACFGPDHVVFHDIPDIVPPCALNL